MSITAEVTAQWLVPWTVPVLGMMGLGLTLAIPKQASAGAAPPPDFTAGNWYQIIFG